MKILALIRVSTAHQDLVQQRNKVIDECIHLGYSKDDIILVEDKESAVCLSEEERNGLNTLKHYIEIDKDINCVISYEISRISRQAKIVFSIRDFLIAHNVQLIIMNPYFKMLKDDGSLSESSNIFFGIFASMAENEGYLRKARMARGKQIKKESGCFTGGTKLFGYSTIKTKAGHKYVIDEKASRIVIDVFMRYVKEDISFRALAKEYLADGTFKDIKFLTLVQKLNDIIRNKKYLGDEQHPQLISEDLFNAAQEKCTKNIINPKRGDNTKLALLKGKLYDKDNGFLLSAHHISKRYYSKRAHGVAVSYKVIEPLIWDFAVECHKKLNDPNRSFQQYYRRINTLHNKIYVSECNIEKYNGQIDKIEERLIIGRLSESKAESMESAINDKIKIEYDNIRKYKEEIDMLENIKDNTGVIKYDELDLSEQIKIVNEIIDKVILHRESRAILIADIHTKFNNIVTYRIDCWKQTYDFI